MSSGYICDPCFEGGVGEHRPAVVRVTASTPDGEVLESKFLCLECTGPGPGIEVEFCVGSLAESS